MTNFIINPENGKTVSIFSREGKRILGNYLYILKQKGGSLRKYKKCKSCGRRYRRRQQRGGAVALTNYLRNRGSGILGSVCGGPRCNCRGPSCRRRVYCNTNADIDPAVLPDLDDGDLVYYLPPRMMRLGRHGYPRREGEWQVMGAVGAEMEGEVEPLMESRMRVVPEETNFCNCTNLVNLVREALPQRIADLIKVGLVDGRDETPAQVREKERLRNIYNTNRKVKKTIDEYIPHVIEYLRDMSNAAGESPDHLTQRKAQAAAEAVAAAEERLRV